MMSLKDKLFEFSRKNGVTLSAIAEAAKRMADDEYKKIRDRKIERNKQLVGRCFVQRHQDGNDVYYKVISAMSSNEYRVECLEFRTDLGKNYYEDCKYGGHFDFDSFYVDSEMATLFDTLTEISYNEYWDAAQKLFNKMMDEKWEI